MRAKSNVHSSWRIQEVLWLFLGCVLLNGAVFAQAGQNPAEAAARQKGEKYPVADAMDRLKQGKYLTADINDLARAGAIQAMPDLAKQFGLTQDPYSKAAIASALVKLGDKDPVYWDYQGRADRHR